MRHANRILYHACLAALLLTIGWLLWPVNYGVNLFACRKRNAAGMVTVKGVCFCREAEAPDVVRRLLSCGATNATVRPVRGTGLATVECLYPGD